MMNITINKYIITLFCVCMILLTGCGDMIEPQRNEEVGEETDLQQNEEVGEETDLQQNEVLGEEADLQRNEELGEEDEPQQNEELSEWEKLYEQWQEKEVEIKLSFGNEIYSVSVVRRCGNDDEDIFMTYNFSLYDADREAALRLLTREEHIITNNVLKAELSNRVMFCISDDSGCIKEIGFAAEADEDGSVYFTVSYLFPHKDKGDVRMSFAGELAYEDWKELMDIVNKSIAERSFDEINILQ